MRAGGGQTRKSYARRVGHMAAMKADMGRGKQIAKKYAMGVAKRTHRMDKAGAKNFASGYVKSIVNDIVRGA